MIKPLLRFTKQSTKRLIDDGIEEKEARYIARDNADFRAKDIAYSEVSDYRRNYKYFKE